MANKPSILNNARKAARKQFKISEELSLRTLYTNIDLDNRKNVPDVIKQVRKYKSGSSEGRARMGQGSSCSGGNKASC